jgi:hypothetical protein
VLSVDGLVGWVVLTALLLDLLALSLLVGLSRRLFFLLLCLPLLPDLFELWLRALVLEMLVRLV